MYPQLWSALSQLKDFNKNQTVFSYDEVRDRSKLRVEDPFSFSKDPDLTPAFDEMDPLATQLDIFW